MSNLKLRMKTIFILLRVKIISSNLQVHSTLKLTSIARNNSGDDDSHSREEVDTRAEHGDSDDVRVCDRAGVVDEK